MSRSKWLAALVAVAFAAAVAGAAIELIPGGQELDEVVEVSRDQGVPSGTRLVEQAIDVFRTNTDFYPEPGNVWDSLAEGYLTAGDTARAIRLYGKSLEMDPGNENGRRMLERIRGGGGQESFFREDIFDMNASWSPDGTRIVFASTRDGDRRPGGGIPYVDLYVVDAEGTEPPGNLTRTPGADEGAGSWSPDGTLIAFETFRDGNGEVYLMAPDGGRLRNLTRSPARDGYPHWSPDGRSLAFASDRSGDMELYLMDADGSNVRRLTRSPGFDAVSSWTPDGERIVFFSQRDEGKAGDLYELEHATGAVRRLTNVHGETAKGSVSPDGERLVFHWIRRDGGVGDIYDMKVDGSERRLLFRSPEWEFTPQYSPDGTRILFDSRRDGRRGIYVMDADGSNVRKVTNRGASPIAARIRKEGADAVLSDGMVARRLAAHPQVRLLEMELRELGMQLLDDGRADDALATLELARSISPGGGKTDQYLAAAYRRLGRDAPPPMLETLAVLDEEGLDAFIIRVRDLSARYRGWLVVSERGFTDVSRLLIANGRSAEAAEVLELAAELYPRSEAVYFWLGQAHEAGGRIDEAISAYKTTLELDPQHSNAARRIEALTVDRVPGS